MTQRRTDDSGVVLLIALFIITTVALVVGALLSSVDVAERSTIALRGAAASTYNGDGAGQVAVNTIRKSTWSYGGNANCLGTASALTLTNFYPATTGTAASSAYVTCTPEQGLSAITGANQPGNAVLTTGTSALEDGQAYGQTSETILIQGGIVSDSNIVAKSSSALVATGGALIRAVTGCAGSVTPTCTAISAPGIADPNYAAPAASLVVAPASLPTCRVKQVAEFYPGLYTSAAVLNACDATQALMHFNPGTYFFDFQDAGSKSTHIWSPSTTVIAGTPTATLNGASPPAVPGACVNPINSINAIGDTFVFGGDSQLAFLKGAAFELCASYSATSIPMALVGLKSTLTNGAKIAHAESGCVIAVNGCDLVSDTNGTKPTFFFDGMAYAPLASLNVQVNNTAKPTFNFGVVFRRVSLTSTASALLAAYISLPGSSTMTISIVDLTVYVCPGASTCSSSGKLKLRARVQISDPTGTPVAGARQITVLGWNLMP